MTRDLAFGEVELPNGCRVAVTKTPGIYGPMITLSAQRLHGDRWDTEQEIALGATAAQCVADIVSAFVRGEKCEPAPPTLERPASRNAEIAAAPWFREAYEGRSLGETMPVDDAPPAPEQRYWRVVRLVPGECWQMERVNAVGEPCVRCQCHYERDYPDPMMARNMAEADGRASGLPEWRPDAVPSSLPTDVTAPGRRP